MNIDKAIEILSQWDKGAGPLYLPEGYEAIKLGIEALREVKITRSLSVRFVVPLLSQALDIERQ